MIAPTNFKDANLFVEDQKADPKTWLCRRRFRILIQNHLKRMN
jgi:hypothetical protein